MASMTAHAHSCGAVQQRSHRRASTVSQPRLHTVHQPCGEHLQGCLAPACRRHVHLVPALRAASQSEPVPKADGEQFEGLLPEEDQQVPGTYQDAINGNTKLGKAIKAACKELAHLNAMETSNLQQAEDLLKKLGFKANLAPTGAEGLFDDSDEEEETEAEPEAQPGKSSSAL